MKKFSLIALLFFIGVYGFFAKPFLLGKFPIPSDTIAGLYYPFRDHYAAQYPRGIPYKNFLITDPVRQTYPWRYLAVSIEKSMQIPLWNPYEMAGYPLLGNLQSAPYYPLNIVFLFASFAFGWSILILLEPILAGIFLYLFLRNRGLHPLSSVMGAFAFSFSGFMVSWLEWGTLGHVALWLPLILLTVDKIFSFKKEDILISNLHYSKWLLLLTLFLIFSFLAGHLQTFFYLFLISGAYTTYRWFQFRCYVKTLLYFVACFTLFAVLTSWQWIPFMQFLLLSARSIDQNTWRQAGWFIPWQHLAGFLAPDFFGNPTTLNYWGVWNYGELTGYIGVLPLLLAGVAFFSQKKREVYFFVGVLLVSLIFALPTPLAILPFQLSLPFVSTAQPTRLLFAIDFSLAVLAAYGLEYLMTEKSKKIFLLLGLFAILYGFLWLVVLGKVGQLQIQPVNLLVARHNLYLPTIFFLLSIAGITAIYFLPRKLTLFLVVILILATAADLGRFADKFTPFTDPSYLYPNTRVLDFLKSHIGESRIMSTDSRILPPNFAIMYHLQSIDGYDPLYLLRYGEYAAAISRNKPDISAPFGFNRIITPQRFDSPLINLLGVKYILSLTDISSTKLQKVYAYGQTKVYENKDVLPRTFFVQNLMTETTGARVIQDIMGGMPLRSSAVVESYYQKNQLMFSNGSATFMTYSPDKVSIKTENTGTGFLVLTDTNYPTWHASVCNLQGTGCSMTPIYRTDFLFRGVVVPKGKHIVNFSDSLL